METVSFQSIGDKRATHIITACDDTDTCPSCGAGYKVGLSACEYCRTPVRLSSNIIRHDGKSLEQLEMDAALEHAERVRINQGFRVRPRKPITQPSSGWRWA